MVIILTSAEAHAPAERLRARATPVMLRDAPSHQSGGILAAGALLHLVTEVHTSRGEVERAASSASNVGDDLRELLGDRAADNRGTVTVRPDLRSLVEPDLSSRRPRMTRPKRKSRRS